MSQYYIIKLIYIYSSIFNIDPLLAVSVATIESRLSVNAIGTLGEVGLFQIRPEYVNYAKDSLFNPYVNVLVGMRLLSKMKGDCKHKIDNTWLVCYNRGITGGNKVSRPFDNEYYKRIMYEYHTLKGDRI